MASIPALREETVHEYEARRTPELTPMELKVLQLMANGENCKSAGVMLDRAPGTIKQICHKVLIKLGADNRTHAVAQGLRRGLIT